MQGFIDELERQRERTAPPVAAPPPAEGQRAGRLHTMELTLAAVGAVAVGTGVILSLKVRSAERDVERYVRETEPYADPQIVAAKMRSGGRLETFQWVAYGVWVASLAGSLASYLLGQRSGEERRVAWAVAPGPHGLSTSMSLRF